MKDIEKSSINSGKKNIQNFCFSFTKHKKIPLPLLQVRKAAEQLENFRRPSLKNSITTDNV